MHGVFSFESLIFIVLVIYIFLSLRKNESGEILSVHNCNLLRGIFAACIIIFHVAKKDDILYGIFNYLSVVVVGMFFFLSGYGCSKQYIKNDQYYKSFPVKRFFGLVLPYIIITIIYWLYFAYTGEYYSLITVIKRALEFAPIVTYSWFIVSVIFHYIVFYCMMLLIGKNKKLFSFFYLVMLMAIVLLVVVKQFSTSMFEAMFAIGVLFAFYEDTILDFIKRYSVIVFLVCATISVVINMVDIRHDELFRMSEQVLFMLCVFSFLCHFNIKSRFIDWLGKLSAYIYMSQGLAKHLIRRFVGGSLFVQDMCIYALCLIISVLLYQVFDRIRLVFTKPHD